MAGGDEEDGLEVISDDDEEDDAADGNGGASGGTVPVVPQVCCPTLICCCFSRLRLVENYLITEDGLWHIHNHWVLAHLYFQVAGVLGPAWERYIFNCGFGTAVDFLSLWHFFSLWFTTS